ncbi:MAG: phosphatase PAP2 family protein [Pseudomonadota bacterium]
MNIVTGMPGFLAQHDYKLSLWLNRLGENERLKQTLGQVSRLGDGFLWHVLILGLPFVIGRSFVPVSLCLALTALSGVWIYKRIKAHYRRPRPYRKDPNFLARAVALDEYSFPSGHTLHATAFLFVFAMTSPMLAILFAPFAIATAVSRVILGMHYVSDVFAGAVVGVAVAGFWLAALSNLGFLSL